MKDLVFGKETDDIIILLLIKLSIISDELLTSTRIARVIRYIQHI